jgi:hypothetical protein
LIVGLTSSIRNKQEVRKKEGGGKRNGRMGGVGGWEENLKKVKMK